MADLTDCDREPIHIPEAIQPHGVLMALSEPELIVTRISENVGDHLPVRVGQILGQPLSTIIDPALVEQVRVGLREERWQETNPMRIEAHGKRFDGIVHRHDGVAILELEPALQPDRPSTPHPFRPALLRMQHVRTVAELAETVVVHMQRVTGFERVLFYRFHDDGHGSVDAEVKQPALETYLGLHYPASDIPVQARQLYLRNWLRLIVDGRATPARIVSHARGARPLDLSFSVLRSVSPIHLEYMANMGVRASMSISLIVRDRLWGLISCLNHTGPRRVAHDVRVACEFLGRLASLQISAFDDHELLAVRAARRATEEALSATMRESSGAGLLESLLGRPNELLGLVDAGGVAVLGGGNVSTYGRTPPPELVQEISAWIEEREGLGPFATESLAAVFPRARAASDVASGLITFALPGSLPRRLLWFRPEVIETVNWGGDPTKSVTADASGRLRPRHSFALWREEVRHHCRPWTASDLEAANDLLQRAMEVDLERRLSSEQRAVRARDEVLALVSHDLKNPLLGIALQAGTMRADDDASRRGVQRIRRLAAQAQTLIADLQDLAKIEAQRFVVRPEPVDIRVVIDEALLGVSALAETKGIRIVTELVDVPTLPADAGQILRVLANLLSNAIKFTPEGGTVTVRTERGHGVLDVTVADTGPGIPADHLPWVFERYWQGRPASQLGAGLGLYVAKGIVEAHGGRIWAESASSGARLRFTLPLYPVRTETRSMA